MLDSVQHTIETSVEDDPATGTYQVARDIFTGPKIFEMEHLGEAAKTIDMIVGHPPEGLEVLCGWSRRAEEVASSRKAVRPKADHPHQLALPGLEARHG